eukprot:CAMPEP_0196719422 /NCGR_PEP_ID=MMETSP1091-20130531/2395_1 /TAXON_ID=302021 /ORGANISM="Rhodomonas sp., Strain CCMP768" /LENGTH=148 /DNA_ID=CAMNT_0042060361 /DNA_START=547 /DNA_END=989 /DNA_ORIENTATION=+
MTLPQSDDHPLDRPRLHGDSILNALLPPLRVQTNHCRNSLAVRLGSIEEAKDLDESAVLEGDHVLRERLQQGEQTSLCVEPRVRLELSVVWLERLDYPGDSELEVAFGAVESADDEVDDTEVEALPVRLAVRHPLLLLLHLAEEVLGL